MNLVRILLLSLLLLPVSQAGVNSKAKQLLSPSETMSTIDKIKKYAIVLGEGEKEIHTFIDPYGAMSQRYLRMIFAKSEVMFKKYRLYLYLLALPRHESVKVIKTIFSSDDTLRVLQDVMLEDKRLKAKDSLVAQKAIREISDAAMRIGVHKRPFIIINGKVR